MIRAVPYTSLWAGTILWILVSSGLLFATGWQLYENYLFAHYSVPTMATVENCYTTVSHDRHGSHTVYHLQYRYQVGTVVADAKSSVNYATYFTVHIGSPLPVLYITENIGHNRIDTTAENNDRARTLYLTLGFTAADLIIGAWIMIYYVRRNQLYRELFARGIPCQGLVTDVNFDLVGKGRIPRYYLVFTFRDQQGGEWTGRTWYLRPGDESRWREQKPISVFYDSRNPQKFTVDLTRCEV